MAITESELKKARARAEKQRANGFAVAATFDRAERVIEIRMSTGVTLLVPVSKVEGLKRATPAKLADIEISRSGLGLRWPKLDADLYVPGLLKGEFNPKRMMAATLGATGGKVRSEAKAAAARENGKLGGRPRHRSPAKV